MTPARMVRLKADSTRRTQTVRPKADSTVRAIDTAWIVAALIVAGAALSGVKLAGEPAQAGATLRVRDVSGQSLEPFKPAGTASVMFFVQTDCPISNWYAPTIQRVCREYSARGVSCALIYEDVELPGSALDAQVRKHFEEYRYDRINATIDRSRAVATRARATVTPQVVVVDRSGDVRYRGRIDNAYADFGRPRQQVTSHELRDALDALLAGRPIAKPETEALGCFIVDPASLRPGHGAPH